MTTPTQDADKFVEAWLVTSDDRNSALGDWTTEQLDDAAQIALDFHREHSETPAPKVTPKLEALLDVEAKEHGLTSAEHEAAGDQALSERYDAAALALRAVARCVRKAKGE